MMRIFRFLLPLFLLALAGGCHKGSNHASDPGTPPAITTQPVDTSTVTGRPVSFVVTAEGAPVLRYQWTKDGVAILGALGSTFTIYDPQAPDPSNPLPHRYSVTITNPNGMITSYAAALTVVPALQFTAAVGIVADASGNLFISDRDDHVVWKVTPAKQVTLLAGSLGIAGSADGKGAIAQFRNPGGLAFDSAGNLVVADTGNHTIRKIAADGTVTTLAGAPGIPGAVDAKGILARFNAPYGLAINATDGVYISDSQNHTIRLMAADGTVSTYAGSTGQPGYMDATSTNAQFNQPNGLALASNGTLYVADYGSSCIRRIDSNAVVSTLAGLANTPAFIDGTGTTAQFNLPVGIAVDATGIVWVADTHNHAIRSITTAGVVSLVTGSGVSGNADGTGNAALFNLPCGIALSPSGNVIVADTGNHILRVVSPAAVVSTL